MTDIPNFAQATTLQFKKMAKNSRKISTEKKIRAVIKNIYL